MPPARHRDGLVPSAIATYIAERTAPPDEVLVALQRRTAALGSAAGMQIGADQGALLTLLTRLVGARRAVEVGTFTGYSSICIARGLAPGGQLLCCDVSETYTAIAREAWAAAGLTDVIELRIAPALETLRALPDDPVIDLAFIDADKGGYASYLDELVPRIRSGGVILVDNTLWSGRVVDDGADDADTVAIRAFNDTVAADHRVESYLLPVGDGLTLIRKREEVVAYDKTLYDGSASHYLRGRPPYSADLLDVLTAELGLDGTGRLLDVGCGPGILAVQLAPAFSEVVGLDPDPGMLAEAARHAAVRGIDGIRWIKARAEDIATLDLPPVRLVTFGQSFHWTDRDLVADAVFDLLVPGGSVAMITHDFEDRPTPPDPPAPLIPHDAIHDVVREFLGPQHRAGQGLRPVAAERYQVSLARSRFPPPRVVYAPGRPDLVRSADEVVSMFLSMSFAAPHLFGTDLDAFVAAVHEVLHEVNPQDRFWDWPGDTWALVATKPA